MWTMNDANRVCERRSVDGAIEEMSKVLHDLCQPLTTLQCRLEMAQLVGTVEAYREAAAAGLVECSRLVQAVSSMREILQATRQAGEVVSRGSG
jgi:signal transduction histidine kinase